jgi:hypothetical protein
MCGLINVAPYPTPPGGGRRAAQGAKMSFQTFESVPQSIVDQQYVPAISETTEDPNLQDQSYLQQTDFEPSAQESTDSNPEINQEPLTMESVLAEIHQDYQNGLFGSLLREYVPFYYPALPNLKISDDDAAAPEEQPTEAVTQS